MKRRDLLLAMRVIKALFERAPFFCHGGIRQPAFVFGRVEQRIKQPGLLGMIHGSAAGLARTGDDGHPAALVAGNPEPPEGTAQRVCFVRQSP